MKINQGAMMKAFVLIAALFFGISASAQTFTQNMPIPDSTKQVFSISFPKPTTIPCTLFLVGRTLDTPTITDDAGDVWETASRGFWYAPCRGRATTVKVAFNYPLSFYGVLGEKSGYFDVDISSQAIDGNSNPSASATLSTTSADFIVGYGWNYTTMTPTLAASPGYVLEGQANAFIETLNQSAPGPVSSSVTYGNGWSGWWVQGIVAFKPAIPNFCICNR